MIPSFDDVENIEGYQPGGYHPVTIGDRVGGQYKIIHKLGFGGFATVWLARDTEAQRYVALKIIMAEYSKDAIEKDLKTLNYLSQHVKRPGGNFVDIPIEDFWITGPNGKHLCIVSEVAGPSIAHLARTHIKRISPNDVRRMALQLAQCLAFLHSDQVGIGHGDLTTSNVLLELGSLDSLPQEELLGILGDPVAEKVRPYTNRILEPGAPEFIYQPTDMRKLSKFYSGNIILIDFGSSFFLSNPLEDCGTPAQFSSPELIFNKENGKHSDVWALACTIFEMRAGEPLFEFFFCGEQDVLESMIGVLGPLPEVYFLEERWSWLKDEKGDEEKKLDEKVSTIRGGISEDEKVAFSDLLRQVLKYNTEERLSMEEILRHPWFSINLQLNENTKV
ncbi:kinase-like protein [Stipitochalara longipes BDJ]|nr:kinase-like protein [Stipitochalara longipes BDJ]